MKTLAISSFFVLFAIAVGVVSSAPAAYADHPSATVSMPPGTGIQGCEETNECFIPADVSVDVGGEVTWSNDDTAGHTVTSGTVDDGPDGKFDSSLFFPGKTFSVTFDEAGEYPYYCVVHPWMVGSVTVAEGMEHGHMNGDGMEGKMMDGESASGMLSDGTKVAIMASEPAADEVMTVMVKFEDQEHVNYDIMVTQNGETVLEDMNSHEHMGSGEHMTMPLDSADPVEVTVTFQGYGIDEKTGPIGEEVVFTNIVPEFGTIAAMILAVAIVSIIAVTARSRLSLVPRI